MKNKNPIPIGEPTPIKREKPQLKRTSSIKDLTQEKGKISTPNSANMSIKSRKFRDIMFTWKRLSRHSNSKRTRYDCIYCPWRSRI